MELIFRESATSIDTASVYRTSYCHCYQFYHKVFNSAYVTLIKFSTFQIEHAHANTYTHSRARMHMHAQYTHALVWSKSQANL
jgi:hypothetical protein